MTNQPRKRIPSRYLLLLLALIISGLFVGAWLEIKTKSTAPIFHTTPVYLMSMFQLQYERAMIEIIDPITYCFGRRWQTIDDEIWKRQHGRTYNGDL